VRTFLKASGMTGHSIKKGAADLASYIIAKHAMPRSLLPMLLKHASPADGDIPRVTTQYLGRLARQLLVVSKDYEALAVQMAKVHLWTADEESDFSRVSSLGGSRTF
jgi:hypothetical protein